MARRLTAEEFVEKAKAVHGDRYDYSQVEYVNSHTKVTISCADHGPFSQIPSNHLRGKGCRACGLLRIGDEKRLTREKFIERAQAIHGDYYDYSQVEYVDAHTKVTIICPEHGSFAQSPTVHLSGSGCRACGLLRIGDEKRLTREKFIERAQAIHGDYYDYSQVEYVDAHTKVTIICPEHGPFAQTPQNHTYGRGKRCPDCAGRNVTTEKFIRKAQAIHGDRYDYSQVEYINNRTAVTIICPDHGPFQQSPDNHLAKKGCLACSGRMPLTAETFVEKAKEIHGDRYDYSQVKYVNHMTAVTIVCPDHGPFMQTPNSHLQSHGCPDCGGSKPLTTATFIENARTVHGDRYDYSSVNYVNGATHVIIICPEHGPFLQTPNNHINGRGCADCAESGFNPSEPGLLYYVAITTDDGDTRYKIGITNYTVEQRFPAPDLARIRIVKTWRYAIGRAAAEREMEILKQYAGDRYYGPDILTGAGNTELFTRDILGLDK